MSKEAPDFESSMKRLEEIVSRLENDNVPLEESIALYEEGVKIGRKCREIMDNADRKIRELSGEQKDQVRKIEKDKE
ncbi:MAG: exodeoxyribonuclease VII small subunit [Candidatus Krumholzibacteriales bacterium]